MRKKYEVDRKTLKVIIVITHKEVRKVLHIILELEH